MCLRPEKGNIHELRGGVAAAGFATFSHIDQSRQEGVQAGV